MLVQIKSSTVLDCFLASIIVNNMSSEEFNLKSCRGKRDSQSLRNVTLSRQNFNRNSSDWRYALTCILNEFDFLKPRLFSRYIGIEHWWHVLNKTIKFKTSKSWLFEVKKHFKLPRSQIKFRKFKLIMSHNLCHFKAWPSILTHDRLFWSFIVHRPFT